MSEKGTGHAPVVCPSCGSIDKAIRRRVYHNEARTTFHYCTDDFHLFTCPECGNVKRPPIPEEATR